MCTSTAMSNATMSRNSQLSIQRTINVSFDMKHPSHLKTREEGEPTLTFLLLSSSKVTDG